LRALSPEGIEMRDQLKMAAGRWFVTGKREVVAGASIARRYPAAGLGKYLSFGRGKWLVVGIMDAGHTSAASEIFGDVNQISADFNRSEVVSSALVRATDPVAVRALINDVNDDRQLNCTAQTERDYYELQTSSGAPVEYVGIVVAI